MKTYYPAIDIRGPLFMTALASIIIFILSTAGPNEINFGSVIGSLLVGFAIFLFMIGLAPHSKVIIDQGTLFYKRKSVDLKKLSDVEALTDKKFLGAPLTGWFYIRLTDKNGCKISLTVGNWVNQNELLNDIGKYAKKSKARVDANAYKLMESAKKNRLYP